MIKKNDFVPKIHNIWTAANPLNMIHFDPSDGDDAELLLQDVWRQHEQVPGVQGEEEDLMYRMYGKYRRWTVWMTATW